MTPPHSRAAVLTDGQLRISIFVNVPALLREMGHDPARVVAAAGLDLALLGDPENTASFVDLSRLLAVCSERTQCDHFGLLLGMRSKTTDLGLIGHLALNSPDAGAALRNLILHLHLHDRGAVPTLSLRGDLAVLGYTIYQSGVVRADQVYDTAMAVIFNIMTSLCGPNWRPTEVLLSRSPPTDAAPYRRFFRAPLRFDADETALAFATTWLEQELPGADAKLRQMLQLQVDSLAANGNGDVVAQLRRVLRTMLVSGSGSQEQVARLFSMHRRTLNRRLRERNTTFHALVEQTRFDIARHYLEITHLPIVEIASTLDYADASAFTRAFRRWTGTTPAAWRAASGSPSPTRTAGAARA
ncbi:MAG: AraC family transcriptional regulator [Betaproteobacteria bacterium]|nr:AraC family transcriptional regulator [Betaproteobacteria bacterium]